MGFRRRIARLLRARAVQSTVNRSRTTNSSELDEEDGGLGSLGAGAPPPRRVGRGKPERREQPLVRGRGRSREHAHRTAPPRPTVASPEMSREHAYRRAPPGAVASPPPPRRSAPPRSSTAAALTFDAVKKKQETRKLPNRSSVGVSPRGRRAGASEEDDDDPPKQSPRAPPPPPTSSSSCSPPSPKTLDVPDPSSASPWRRGNVVVEVVALQHIPISIPPPGSAAGGGRRASSGVESLVGRASVHTLLVLRASDHPILVLRRPPRHPVRRHRAPHYPVVLGAARHAVLHGFRSALHALVYLFSRRWEGAASGCGQCQGEHHGHRPLPAAQVCFYSYAFCCGGRAPREMNKGDEVAWYADGDNMVRNEYNPSIAYAFGECC
ncbi:hypothetical protein EJB05_37930, partial [Eragrostis curvula]